MTTQNKIDWHSIFKKGDTSKIIEQIRKTCILPYNAIYDYFDRFIDYDSYPYADWMQTGFNEIFGKDVIKVVSSYDYNINSAINYELVNEYNNKTNTLLWICNEDEDGWYQTFVSSLTVTEDLMNKLSDKDISILINLPDIEGDYFTELNN